MTQIAFSEALGVTQPTVSRWEKTGVIPSEHQPDVRRLGMAASKKWSDTLFFEVPADFAKK